MQHSNTLAGRRNYADLLRAMGRDEEAEPTTPHDEHNAAEAEQRAEQP
jgi:hypothetical protein